MSSGSKFLIPESSILRLLDSCRSMSQLKQIHARIIESYPSIGVSYLVDRAIYFCAISPNGSLNYAKILFKELKIPTVFSWNSLIRGLSLSKNPEESLSFYQNMIRRGFRPNNFTFPFVIKACTELGMNHFGILIHCRIVKTGLELDSYVQSSLIQFYVNNRDLKSALQLFNRCSQRDVVVWNSIIDGCIKCGDLKHAQSLFDSMEHRDVVTWNTMMNGYGIHGKLEEAQKMFDEMPEKNIVSWNSMLAAHLRLLDTEGARKRFDEMPNRDVVSWNAMLTCYAQAGQCSEALYLFDKMLEENIKPTEQTIVSILSACTHTGALQEGERLRLYTDKHKINMNTILGTAFVDMYAKCGKIEDAFMVFSMIQSKDVLSWNTMIAGMGLNGHTTSALQLFDEMQNSGIQPDDMTFVAVISACSHTGEVEYGWNLFKSMKDVYGIDPKVEHYGCIIDLLSRAGLMEHAIKLIEEMPVNPNAHAWGALLGGCKIHGNAYVGEQIGKRLIKLEPHHCGRYVLLSNIYAAANRWEDAMKVRNIMKSKGVTKRPGLSTI